MGINAAETPYHTRIQEGLGKRGAKGEDKLSDTLDTKKDLEELTGKSLAEIKKDVKENPAILQAEIAHRENNQPDKRDNQGVKYEFNGNEYLMSPSGYQEAATKLLEKYPSTKFTVGGDALGTLLNILKEKGYISNTTRIDTAKKGWAAQGSGIDAIPLDHFTGIMQLQEEAGPYLDDEIDGNTIKILIDGIVGGGTLFASLKMLEELLEVEKKKQEEEKKSEEEAEKLKNSAEVQMTDLTLKKNGTKSGPISTSIKIPVGGRMKFKYTKNDNTEDTFEISSGTNTTTPIITKLGKVTVTFDPADLTKATINYKATGFPTTSSGTETITFTSFTNSAGEDKTSDVKLAKKEAVIKLESAQKSTDDNTEKQKSLTTKENVIITKNIYQVEGENSVIIKNKDIIIPKDKSPITLTGYPPLIPCKSGGSIGDGILLIPAKRNETATKRELLNNPSQQVIYIDGFNKDSEILDSISQTSIDTKTTQYSTLNNLIEELKTPGLTLSKYIDEELKGNKVNTENIEIRIKNTLNGEIKNKAKKGGGSRDEETRNNKVITTISSFDKTTRNTVFEKRTEGFRVQPLIQIPTH